MPTTVLLREYLLNDPKLCRICGFASRRHVPCESTFSRAFREFSAQHLPNRIHEILIKEYHSERLVGHISRDATEIDARERVDRARTAKMLRKK